MAAAGEPRGSDRLSGKSTDLGGKAGTHSSQGFVLSEGQEPVASVWSVGQRNGNPLCGRPAEPGHFPAADDNGKAGPISTDCSSIPPPRMAALAGRGTLRSCIRLSPMRGRRRGRGIWVGHLLGRAVCSLPPMAAMTMGAAPTRATRANSRSPKDQPGLYPGISASAGHWQCVQAAEFEDLPLRSESHCGHGYRAPNGRREDHGRVSKTACPSSFGFPSCTPPRWTPITLFPEWPLNE